MPGMNTIGWFEIGTDDPATAERFYGDLFGWAVTHDPAVSADPAYRLVTTADGEGMRGGLVTTDGAGAGYAVFCVRVEDVEATCRHAEVAGGTVRGPVQVTPAGVRFAHLTDPTGNRFEVFSPPPARP